MKAEKTVSIVKLKKAEQRVMKQLSVLIKNKMVLSG